MVSDTIRELPFVSLNELRLAKAKPVVDIMRLLPQEIEDVLQRVEANPPFPNEPWKPYYVIVREDDSIEILKAPLGYRVFYFLGSSSPTFSELETVRQCAADDLYFKKRSEELRNDPTIIHVETYGFPGWPRLRI